MRRRPKTPILSITPPEDGPRAGNVLGRTSSVDLIAEQYRALLESRPSSVYSDAYSEPALSPQGSDRDHDEPLTLKPRSSSSVYLPGETRTGTTSQRATVELPDPSPTSDDGTLVSFQDETVYFKPISFSPRPESPLLPPSLARHSCAAAASAASADGNVSLQICLDLLTRELSSAMAGRPSCASATTSALQVWAMIEAYERLRDQVVEDSRGGNAQQQATSMEMMFDVWLRALYSIHDSLAGAARREGNDDEAELGPDELV
ncbi:d4be1734-70ec-4bbb-8220-0be42932db58 [Thermothielavioides terrestris]|nr:d4be1734-70ec-4bbb-8220-0be42932db58 [Thermothielavioides terrestris]